MPTINIEIKTIDGVKFPTLKDSSDKVVNIDSDDTVTWQLPEGNDSKITIKADKSFNGQSGGSKEKKGDGSASTPIKGKKDKDRIISYDVIVEGCDAPLDPVIVVSKKPPLIPDFLNNPIIALIIGFILGLLFSNLFG
ncbi:MAG: hypothetical protein HWE16_03415 [Gammaproteobacteria bacterium]|nr:hypothetical protein [Gammaproteobacteria bacterium]